VPFAHPAGGARGWVWVALGVLAGGLFGLAAVVEPRAAVGVPVGVAAVIGAWRSPKSAVAATVIGLLFAPMIVRRLPAFQSFDEAATVLLAGIAVARAIGGVAPVRAVPALPWFAVFVVAGLASAVRADVPPGIVAQDLLLLGKGLVLMAVVVQLEWTTDDLDRGIRLGVWVVAIAAVCVLLNLALGPLWYAWFSQNGKLIARAGIPSPIGPFGHPGAAGQAMAMIGSAALAYSTMIARDARARWIWIAALVVAILTLRRKAILGFLLASSAVIAQRQAARRAALVLAALVVPLIVLLAWSSLTQVASYTYDDYFGARTSEAARTVLYTTSVDIARENFPLGAGFGRYGTFAAFVNYSPLYYDYGFPQVWGLAPVTGRFSTDTFWPAVLGEGGVLGLIGYGGGMLAIGVSLIRRARRAHALGRRVDPRVRFLLAVAIAWWVEFLIESIAAPVYASPPLYAAFWAVLGLAFATSRELGGAAGAAGTGIGAVTVAGRSR
jgi:O-Antigen ligase